MAHLKIEYLGEVVVDRQGQFRYPFPIEEDWSHCTGKHPEDYENPVRLRFVDPATGAETEFPKVKRTREGLVVPDRWDLFNRERLIQPDYWTYRGRIFLVQTEWARDEEIAVRIKHATLRQDREMQRIRREIEALENMDRVNSARRERIPDAVRLFVWQRDSGRCVKCGSKQALEFDHIIPVAEGGSNTDRNVQLLCEACNRAKGRNV